MADVRPLRGLRYDVARVGALAEVLCPPYDVIDAGLAAALRARSPYNAIHLELPADGPGDARYARAAARLADWEARGVLRREATPCLYPVEEEFVWAGARWRRRGVLALVRLVPWEAGEILPHERTLAGPKADRLALLRACRANLSPVFLLHPPLPAAQASLWEAAAAHPPVARVELSTHERLRLWAVSAPADWSAALTAARLYVADGHHRYETALRYRDELRARGERVPVGADYVLAYLVALDDPGLLLLPTHRCAPVGIEVATLERLLAERFDCTALALDAGRAAEAVAALRHQAAARPGAAVLGVYVPGRLWLATPRPEAARWLPAERHPAWRALDVAQADGLLLQPLLGPQAAERLSYTRDAAEALARVDQGAAAFAVLLNPLTPAQMVAVAEAGERMPQKSTYFHPKLPTGLVFHRLDDHALG
ncbi:MAG TPA: DUF1015 domain-containing protein [Chloroflexota bacterium]|nr:DUF1015 domain-containing protein [Chloroflexota bacterium]